MVTCKYYKDSGMCDLKLQPWEPNVTGCDGMGFCATDFSATSECNWYTEVLRYE